VVPMGLQTTLTREGLRETKMSMKPRIQGERTWVGQTPVAKLGRDCQEGNGQGTLVEWKRVAARTTSSLMGKQVRRASPHCRAPSSRGGSCLEETRISEKRRAIPEHAAGPYHALA